MRTWEIERIPDEPKTHVVVWVSESGEMGISKPLSEGRAEWLAKVGNEYFKLRHHFVEELINGQKMLEEKGEQQ